MSHGPDFRCFAYLIVALGGLLSFAAAVVPFYDGSYDLRVAVLVIGLMPYVVYGLFTDVVRGWPLLIAGTLVFGIDLGIKIPERFLHFDGYAGNAVYYAPLLATFVILPLILGIGARRERRWRGVRDNRVTAGHADPASSPAPNAGGKPG
jgi:hypothetical protein